MVSSRGVFRRERTNDVRGLSPVKCPKKYNKSTLSSMQGRGARRRFVGTPRMEARFSPEMFFRSKLTPKIILLITANLRIPSLNDVYIYKITQKSITNLP